MPTLNYDGPKKTQDHFLQDVAPYWLFKNTPNDSTSLDKIIFGPGSLDQNDPGKRNKYKNYKKKLGEENP